MRQDDVSVRSGPGRAFYPTSKLKVGERVTVVRHNHGGWYMIQPPADSFSWIPARTVERTEGNRGTITVNNTPARVGSDESDIRDVVQRNLAKGEVVEIIGEKVLTNADGRKELWLKIAPPKYEWRYVLGQFVTTDVESVVGEGEVAAAKLPSALSAGTETAAPADGDSSGPSLPGPSLEEAGRLLDELATKGAKKDEPVPAEPEPESKAPLRGSVPAAPMGVASEGTLTRDVARAEVRRLDAKLQSLLESPPENWLFDELKADYDRLLAEADDGEIDALIQTRLRIIGRHEAAGREAARIADVRRATEARDAELAARLKSLDDPSRAADRKAGTASDTPRRGEGVKPAGFTVASATTKNESTPPRRLPAPGLDNSPAPSDIIPALPDESGQVVPTGATPAGTPQPAPTPPATAAPRFVGAGIVQRAPTPRHQFAPPFHLVAPNGKHLAWLVADPGVDLTPWVGKAVGLSGERSKFPQLQSDMIRVTGASPVRLAP